jgi:hypothetical protein
VFDVFIALLTRFSIACAEQLQVKWAQHKINRAAKHRANLLAATRKQLEKELSSCAARCASPVVGDDSDAVTEQPAPQPEQDSPG